MERDLEKVQEFYAAWRKQDLKRMLLCITDEFRAYQSGELPWGGEHLGRSGLQEFIQGITGRIQSRFEIDRCVDAGEHVVACGRMAGTAKATGLQFDIPFVHLWTFRAGDLVRLDAYVDNPTILTALGA